MGAAASDDSLAAEMADFAHDMVHRTPLPSIADAQAASRVVEEARKENQP
jgi:hypothetical protein